MRGLFGQRFLVRRPVQGVDNQAHETWFFKIFLLSQGGVKNPAALIIAGPGDRLGLAWNAAGEQNVHVLGQPRVFVERAFGLEGFETGQQRVILALGNKMDVRQLPLAEMALVVATQNLLVEIEPILKGVAGRAQADDRLTGKAILLDPFQLLPLDGQAAGVKQHDIAGFEVFQAG